MKIIEDTNPIIYIYCIENKTNGKRYIGQTNSYTNRSNRHLYELNKGIHYNKDLQSDYNAEHDLICSIIEKCDYSVRYTKENFWINYYDSINNGYNQTSGSKPGIKKEFSELRFNNLRNFHKSRKGKHRKTRVIEAVCLITGKVHTFMNLVEAGKFFHVKGHTMSKVFKKNLLVEYKGYSLKREL